MFGKICINSNIYIITLTLLSPVMQIALIVESLKSSTAPMVSCGIVMMVSGVSL